MNALLRVGVGLWLFVVFAAASPPAVAQSCAADPGNLLAWWPAAGDAQDIQGASDGTLRNGAAFAAGRVGQAFSLDGVNDHVTTPLDVQPATRPATTWEAWIFPTRVNFATRQAILCADDGGYDRCVNIEAGTSSFGVFTGTGVWQPTSVTPNQWQHIAVVYTPANILFYKNGVEFSFGAPPVGGASSAAFTIGANPFGGFTEPYQGLADEPRVYDDRLTRAEIQAIVNAGPSGICRTLSINDVTVNENAGTATFTVTNVNAAGVTVTVGYATENGTASQGQDYTSAGGTLTFQPGEISKSIPVAIANDVLVEADETFHVRLSSPTGATLDDALGAGTIISDDTPAPPAALSPGTAAAPGPVLPLAALSFHWSPVASATRYGFYVLTAAGVPVYTNTGITATSFTLPALDGGAYRWRVTAFGGAGESASSNVLHFQIPLAAPVAIAPGGSGELNSPATNGAPLFRWSAVPGASGYRLAISTTAGNTILDSSVTGTEFTLPVPFHPGLYRWQVSAFGAAGESAASQSLYFRVPPATVRALDPGSAALPGSLVKRSPTFRWSAVDGATRYGLYIFSASSAPVYTNVNVTGTSFTLPVPLASDAYQWHVTAFTAAEESALSNPRFIHVPPASPQVLSPGSTSAPGDVFRRPSDVTFVWAPVERATHYTLSVTIAPHRDTDVVYRRTNLTGTSFKPLLSLGNGQYRWYATASNALGDSGAGNKRYFEIAVPGAPIVTSAVPHCDPVTRAASVRLTWSATPGATSYGVLRNGELLAVTGATAFEDRSGLSAGQTYTYMVRADTAGGTFGSRPRGVAVAANLCTVPIDADLMPSGVAVGATTVQRGSSLAIRLKIWNHGGTSAPPSRTRIILTAGEAVSRRDPILAEIATPKVRPGRAVDLQVTAQIPETVLSGTYAITAQADAFREVRQFDPSNDSARSPAFGIGSAPVCALGCSASAPSRVFVNAPVQFAAAFSGAAACGMPDVAWNFGDETSEAGAAPSHVYKTPGRYSWTVDAKGSAESCRLAGTVEVIAPPMTTLQGIVSDDLGNAISGAAITIESAGIAIAGATSVADGSYAIEGLTAGQYTAKVEAPEFAALAEPLDIMGGLASMLRDFSLVKRVHPVTVTSLLSRYPPGTYFLDGETHSVFLTADVDWSTHVPDLVRFRTPRIADDSVRTTSRTATKRFDMGFGAGPCGNISATARAADGVESDPVVAPYFVMSRPWFAPTRVTAPRYVDGADNFRYRFTAAPDFLPPSEMEIRDDIPVIGDTVFTVDGLPEIEAEVRSDGQALLSVDQTFELGELRKVKFEAEIAGALEGLFDPQRCVWDWSGSLGLSGSMTLETPAWKTIAMIGVIPIPVYAKASLTLSAGGTVVASRDRVGVDEVFVELVGRGTLAAGIDEVAAIEGWVELGGRYRYKPVDEPHHLLSGILRVGGAAYVWRLRHEFVLFDGIWPSDEDDLRGSLRLQPGALRLDERRWRAEFVPAVQRRSGRLAVLSANEYPQATPEVVNDGAEAIVAWLTDVPSRSAINGTAVVTSTASADGWSEPVIVDDDGTADYHPRAAATPAGTLLVWEDGRAPLDDATATLQSIAEGTEISVAESAGFGTWSRVTQLTANAYLDRSPQISGDSLTSAMAVWIANRDNDLFGSDARPNELWFAKRSSAGWSKARRAATLPFHVVRTALAFANGRATVVLGGDLDGDPSTTADRELFALTFADGTWSPVDRLTRNDVADDAPSLLATDAGTRLFWLRGGDLSTCTGLAVDSATVIESSGDTGRLGGYRVAASRSTGAMAVVWSQPTEFNSDLHVIHYDPVARRWGRPQQLTNDQEVEKYVSAALDRGGRLLIASDRAILRSPAQSLALAQADPPSDEVALLTVDSVADLAVEALAPSARTALPDDTVAGSVTVANRGSVAVPSFRVDFHGDDMGDDMGDDADILGSVAVAQPLVPGATMQLPWSFVMPPVVPRQLFAVVRAETVDGDATNDRIRVDFGSPDLAIAVARVEHRGRRTVFVTRVTNAGNLVSDATSLTARNAVGSLLGSASIPPLQPGHSIDVAVRASANGKVTLTIDEKGETTDAQRGNNARTVTAAKPDDSAGGS